MAGLAVTDDHQTEEVTGGPLGKKGLGWAIFEFARNPYYNAIVIGVFAPYFGANVVAGIAYAPDLGDAIANCFVPDTDSPGARGQALVARTITIAGVIMAFVAPILGSMIDKGGSLKPVLFAALSTLAITSTALWFVKPGEAGAVPLGMTLMAIGYVAYSISELFHNAMLPMAGRPSALPMISGLGLAFGNFAGITVLALMAVLFTNPDVPLFGLDKPSFEHLRISGPVVGLWLTIFIIPFFLFMPDIVKSPERSWRTAARNTFAGQGGPLGMGRKAGRYVSELFRLNPNVMRFLVGRMIYADGIAALLTIGSVYVGSFLCWSPGQLITYNIVGGLCAVVGALLGGKLDQTIGPKRSLVIELSVIIVVLTVQLSVTPESLFFGLVPSSHVVWAGGPFQTLTDVFYFAMIVPAGLMLGACISSSRYMLVHISPPDQIGRFFGFYAMAGSVTVWLGPGLVDLMTTLSGDQRIGMSGLGILFIIGLIIILGVKADKTPEHLKANPT